MVYVSYKPSVTHNWNIVATCLVEMTGCRWGFINNRYRTTAIACEELNVRIICGKRGENSRGLGLYLEYQVGNIDITALRFKLKTILAGVVEIDYPTGHENEDALPIWSGTAYDAWAADAGESKPDPHEIVVSDW